MNIMICCPSYKRPNVKSFDFFGNLLNVFVAEKEYNDYIEQNKQFKKNIIKVDNKYQGNVARIRNYILDYCNKKNVDVCVIVDDDLKYIGYYQNGIITKLKQEQIKSFIEKYTFLCEGFGFKLWGVNLNKDKQLYKAYTPFSTTSVILGPFCCFLKGNETRYDESLPLKEDYDIALQNLNKYRGILRVNKYHYDCEQSTNKGGCATYRNIEKEKEQLYLLQKKWGKNIVKIDSSDRSHKCNKGKKIDYNPVIKVPIKGV